MAANYPGPCEPYYGTSAGPQLPYPPNEQAPRAGYPNPQSGTTSYQHGGPPPAGAVPHQGGDTTTKSGRMDDEPSAPPIELMDQVPGYNNIGFEGVMQPPPSYEEAMREPQDRPTVRDAPVITEDDARDAILEFANDHCCYRAAPAREMKFNDLVSYSAFHYKLETFGEGRSTKWASEPYTGCGINVTGPAPLPWDIQAQPPQVFKNSTVDIEVPNTASVKPCHSCHGQGTKTCSFCFGAGRNQCFSCNGNGRDNNYQTCRFCRGGWKMCYSCNGSGRTQCSKCRGRANLRWFILLTIKWTNHVGNHVIQNTSLPHELVTEVSGQVAFEETYPRVWPVNHFPEQDINKASKRLVNEHGSSFPSERILMQRHKVQIVPVTEVFYRYKDSDSSFFVYGFEHKVFSPDYPGKCCCSIL